MLFSHRTLGRMTMKSTRRVLGHSLAPLTHSLCPHCSLCSRAPLCSFARSLSLTSHGNAIYAHAMNASVSKSFNPPCTGICFWRCSGLHVSGHRRLDASTEGNGGEEQKTLACQTRTEEPEENASQTIQRLAHTQVTNPSRRKHDAHACGGNGKARCVHVHRKNDR